jgi:hypothetical protein
VIDAIDTQAERDSEHANAKKSVDMLVAFEERDKKNRKDLARMSQTLVWKRGSSQCFCLVTLQHENSLKARVWEGNDLESDFKLV